MCSPAMRLLVSHSRGGLSLTAHGFVALRLSLTHRRGFDDRVLPVILFDQAVHRRFGNAGEPLEVGGLAVPIFSEFANPTC